MRFPGFFYPLAAVLTLAGPMMAADQAPATEPQAGVVKGDVLNLPRRSFFARPQSSEPTSGTAEPFIRPDQSGQFQFQPPSLHRMFVDCYTMRTYMVKASERVVDDESGFRGYSTCQLASSYHVRSADAREETGAKLK